MIIRNFLFYLGLIPVTIFFSFFTWLFFFTPLRIRYWIATRWSHFFIWWAKITCGLKYHVSGLEHIHGINSIVLSNHQSAWETIFLQVLLPPQSWVLKKELLYIPVFGWGLWLLNPIAISRKKLRSANELIKQGENRLKSGLWVVIFPEGTRVAPDNHRAFSRSGAALSKASGYPIIPLAHNAGRFWPKGFFIKKPGTIKVRIGPLILPLDKTITEINNLASEWIKRQNI